MAPIFKKNNFRHSFNDFHANIKVFEIKGLGHIPLEFYFQRKAMDWALRSFSKKQNYKPSP